jgi:class 3 adenylate cyclase
VVVRSGTKLFAEIWHRNGQGVWILALESDLASEVTNILRLHWSVRNGSAVPETEEVAVGNEGVKLDAAVLSVDLSDSIVWAQNGPPEFAAELYKIFLRSANRVISGNHGRIVDFDSGRFMAVFAGPSKSSHAMKSALQIHYVSDKILTPRIVERYPSYGFPISYGIGIDVSPVLVVRTGVRGSNDLLWVGRAPNLAARLSALRTGPPAAWVTADVFEGAHHTSRISASGTGAPMWERIDLPALGVLAYRSGWNWPV